MRAGVRVSAERVIVRRRGRLAVTLAPLVPPASWLHSARAAYLDTLEYVSRDDQQAIKQSVFVSVHSGAKWCMLITCRSPKSWSVKA
jgi:hypothetical protein